VIKQPYNFIDEEVIYLGYPHYQFEVIEHNDTMIRCIQTHTQKKFTAFKSLLGENNGKHYFKSNYVNRFFNLDEGDIVQICDIFDDCILENMKMNLVGYLKSRSSSKN